MGYQVQIGQLERAINRYKLARPFNDYVLPVELRLMADLYGKMIYFRLSSADLGLESVPTQVVVEYWGELSCDQRGRVQSLEESAASVA